VTAPTDLPIVAFPSAAEWEEWLEANHADSPGVWVRIAKRDSGLDSVRYPEVLDVALCFGWIDGQRRAGDERTFLQRMTPRGPRSRWSRINRDRADELTAQGRMRAAGRGRIEDARADGRWDAAYEPQSRATVPDDLRRALDANPPAREAFGGLDSRNRYAILYRVQEAKRPETRARRIEQFVAMLAEGRRPHE
jgi:uncharacterized protein YdeI (YjbR/CyaY-like superfamily)